MLKLCRLPRRRTAEAAGLLARALHDDPFARWLLPDEGRRRRTLRVVEHAVLADARPFGYVCGVFGAGELLGVTAWLPPGTHRQGAARQLRQLRQVPRLLRAAVHVRGRAADALRVAEAERRTHPDLPHWWLVVAAVDPPRQGRHMGELMLEGLVIQAERDHLPAYLRTTNERNLGYYARWGFEVRDEVRAVPAAPPMWLMWREPGAT